MGAGTVRCVPWAALGCFICFLHCSHPPAQPLGDGETEARVAGRGEGRANDKPSWYPQLSPVVAMRPRTHSCPLPTTAPPPQPFPPQQPCREQRSRLLRQFSTVPVGLRHRCPHLRSSPPLRSPHPIPAIGGSHTLPLLPKTGGLQHWGYCHGGKPRQGTPKEPQGSSLADPRAQASPGSPPPQNCPPKKAPPTPLPATPSQALTFGGSPHGGQREVAKDQQHHSQPRGTQRPRPHPRAGPPEPRPRPTSGAAAPCRVPLAVSGRYPGNAGIGGGPRGPCPDSAAPSLLFSAAAHKIFSLTTVRARARACLGNREGENRAAPPRRSGWEGRAASCLSFPSHSRRIQVVLAGGRQESSQQPMETPGAAQKGQLKGHSASQGESGVPGRLWGPHRAAALQ